MKAAAIILFLLLCASVASNMLIIESSSYVIGKHKDTVSMYKGLYLHCNGDRKRNNKFFNNLGK